MPRKTKEDKELKEKNITTKSTSNTTKKVSSSKNTDKTPATSKKAASTSKKVTTKSKESATSKKTSTKSKSTTTKAKATSKSEKATTKKTSKTKTATEKKETSKTTSKAEKTTLAAKKADTKTTSKKSSEDKKTTKTSASKSKKEKANSTTKTTNSSKKEKEKKVTPNTEKSKEETIIEKIKSFIAKIVAMQEEAKNEELAKKETKKANKKVKTEKKIDIKKLKHLPEYYDLPYRYNETVVKVLAQTPKRIFVYWDVADEDRIRYEKAFGKDFYEKTYPVLLVHNDDKDYTMEVPINDFANSWYIDINDSKSKYSIQLGRKFKVVPTKEEIEKVEEYSIILKTDYLPIAQSNILEVPNDRILFNRLPRKIVYRNVKTYEEKEKLVEEIKTPLGILFNLKDFYKNNYKDEINNEEILDLNNPTSGGLSSSTFK